MGILWTILIGFIAGVLAKLLTPGDNEPSGFFRGHITSELIKRVLKEKPVDVVGLSIPSMPSGVPGMEGPKDGPINVYSIKKDGTTTTYATQ